MFDKKLLIASSSKNEAITQWVLKNSEFSLLIDVILIADLLKHFDIRDELEINRAKICWQLEQEFCYTNQTHYLLNRVTNIEDNLFHSFCIEDREYAKKEFEAYLGFAFNAFQSPQNHAINGVCEQIKSLPQQWQMMKDVPGVSIPDYSWSSPYYRPFRDRETVVKSSIYDFFNWSVDSQNEPNDTGFYFVKPTGVPVFVCCIGTQYFVTSEVVLTRQQEEQIDRLIEFINQTLRYFIFELLIFVNGDQLIFGCINIDVIRSAEDPRFNDFMKQHLIKEWLQCLN